MKKIISILVSILSVFVMSSCGVGIATVFNQNQNITQVHLSTNNYNIVNKATGSADVTYVLFFGGMNKKQLYENAYSAMINDAKLDTGSKAVINILTEEHIGGFPPLYYKRTLTVSANVIEFTR